MSQQLNSQAAAKNPEALTKLLLETVSAIQNGPETVRENPKEWSKLVQASSALQRAAQKPTEIVIGFLSQTVQFTSMRLFVSWGVFDSLPEEGAISYEELSKVTGVEAKLLSRFSRMLIATGILKEIGQDSIAHTATSKQCTADGPLKAMVCMAFDDNFPTMVAMPGYFEEYGLKEPQGKLHTVNAYAKGDPTITVWEHMNRKPDLMKNTMLTMKAMGQMISMTGPYDFSWVASEATKSSDRPLVIDVGGGKGHCLQAILAATPGIPPERCILEDLDKVVEEAQASAEGELKHVQFRAGDFHKAQPVKEALIYYIRRCIHDYGDEDAIEILQHLQEAMAPDSRVLIVEQVVSSTPTIMDGLADFVMATIGGKERSVSEFQFIAEKAGLKIKEVHTKGESDVSVIECVKA